MRVSELEGALLDYWVAMAEDVGRKDEDKLSPELWRENGKESSMCMVWYGGGCSIEGGRWDQSYCPSSDWQDGGPIIERERVDLGAVDMMGEGARWCASMGAGIKRYRAFGPTPLVAAMRAYVGLQFGDEVPDDVL